MASQTKELQNAYLVAQGQFAVTLQDLSRELKRMKEKGVDQEFIDAKSRQIDTLVEFNNTIEDLVQVQKLIIAGLRIENTEMWGLLDKMSKSKNSAFEELIRYVTETRENIKRE